MYTQIQANGFAKQFQWLIGQKFITPYGILSIDMVQFFRLDDGTYQVYVLHNAFSKHSIPEFYGFQNPKLELTRYLEWNNIPFNPEMYP